MRRGNCVVAALLRGRAVLLATLLGGSVLAPGASGAALDRFTWQQRLLLVFSPGETHADFRRQQAILERVGPGLAERDLVVLRISPGQAVTIDGSPDAKLETGALYRDFDIDPAAFAVILIGKDGTRKLTRAAAVEAGEVFDLIDSMPMRQWEMQQRSS